MAIFNRYASTTESTVGRETFDRTEDTVQGAPGLPFTLDVIPSSVHGLFDYTLGFGAILAPYLFGFAHHTPARLAMQMQGAGVILYSLLTNYEWSLSKVIPFRTHLLLDFFGGSFLAASPWLLGFPRLGRFHLMLGLVEFAITMLSRRRPYSS